jgi:hypothetical protein
VACRIRRPEMGSVVSPSLAQERGRKLKLAAMQMEPALCAHDDYNHLLRILPHHRGLSLAYHPQMSTSRRLGVARGREAQQRTVDTLSKIEPISALSSRPAVRPTAARRCDPRSTEKSGDDRSSTFVVPFGGKKIRQFVKVRERGSHTQLPGVIDDADGLVPRR